MGEFRISHVRITFGRGRWKDKKGGHQGSWMEPPRFFFWRWGSRHPSIPAPSPRRWQLGATPSPQHPNTTPILPHIDEDALEGLYFAFSLILRCLPYFFRKTRPRASYELLEAFSPSCGECGGHLGGWRHNPPNPARTWEPGILKVGLSITPEPAIRFRDREAQGGASRPSESDNPNPACHIPRPPIPIPPP